jgi:hypothetical protein
MVDTDSRSAVTSPSGTWPYQLNFPQGSSTTRSFTVTAGATVPSTPIGFFTGPSDQDISNPANRTASCAVLTNAGS